jgi:hypothetical protein
MATAACRFSALLWSFLLLICLLVASTDSTTFIKTHISTAKITVNEQHADRVVKSATTGSEPMAARSEFGNPFASTEEDSPGLDLSKRTAQIDVPPSGRTATGTGDSKSTSGIPGSTDLESIAGNNVSGGSARNSSQGHTEPKSTLQSQGTHSTNVQNTTNVSDSDATSRLSTQSGSGETSRPGALPKSDTAGVGTKPGNNSTSSSLLKHPPGTGRNTTAVATPSSGSEGALASTPIPLSSTPPASSISATIPTSVISNGSLHDTGNSDHTATTSTSSSISRNVSMTGRETLRGNSSAVLRKTASLSDTPAASLNSALSNSSSISSTRTRSPSTSGPGTSNVDSAKPSLATTSDSSLQPSSSSISDSGSRRNFTALTSGKTRGAPSVVTLSSSTSSIVDFSSRSSGTSDVLPHTSATGTNQTSSISFESTTGKETMPRSTTGPTTRPRSKPSTEDSTVPTSTDTASMITGTPVSSTTQGMVVPQWVTLQTGEWRESALLMSCKAPCTLNLPPISLEPSAVLQYSAVTGSICTHVGNQIYRFATTVSVDPVTITELTLDPVSVGTMTAGQPAVTGEAGFQYPAGVCSMALPPGEPCVKRPPDSTNGTCGPQVAIGCPDMQCCGPQGTW